MGLKKYAYRTALGVFGAFLVCNIAMDKYMDAIQKTPAITSQSHLEEVVAKSAKNIDPDFDPERIICKLVDESVSKCSRPGVNYVLVVGGDFANESMVRHETYHIVDGHVDLQRKMGYVLGKLAYLPYFEPKAIIHQFSEK